jgi:hypothetical protein
MQYIKLFCLDNSTARAYDERRWRPTPDARCHHADVCSPPLLVFRCEEWRHTISGPIHSVSFPSQTTHVSHLDGVFFLLLHRHWYKEPRFTVPFDGRNEPRMISPMWPGIEPGTCRVRCTGIRYKVHVDILPLVQVNWAGTA